MLWLKNGTVGGMYVVATCPVCPKKAFTIAFMSMAWLIARRTLTSLNGPFWTFIARYPIVSGGRNSTLRPDCLTDGTSSGVRPSAAESSPPVSAATLEVLSGMERMVTFLTFGPPPPSRSGTSEPHQFSLASSSAVDPLFQETNLYGPVPMGFCQKPSTSSFIALGEAMPNGLMATFLRNGAWVCLRLMRTVYSSTTSTPVMVESPSKPLNWPV